MCRLNDPAKTSENNIKRNILYIFSCIFYIHDVLGVLVLYGWIEMKLSIGRIIFVKQITQLKQWSTCKFLWCEMVGYCTTMSVIVTYAVYSRGHPPVSPSLSSASTFAPAFTRAKMASALPEGQEALEVESACSENTPVGGQAQPVSSNTTEVRHTKLWGCQHHTVYYTDRRCVNTTRDCKNLMHTVQSITTVLMRLPYLGRYVIAITWSLTLCVDVK